MKKITLPLIATLLFSMIAETPLIFLVTANPLPSIDPKVIIVNPENITYHVNTVTLLFITESTFGVNSIFYSLDGQTMIPVEDVTLISRDDINIGKNPSVYRTVLECRCELYNLSGGKHNVTAYQISHPRTPEQYKAEDTWGSSTIEFMVETYSPIYSPRIDAIPIKDTPTTLLLAIVSMTGICTGLVFYFKKRKR